MEPAVRIEAEQVPPERLRAMAAPALAAARKAFEDEGTRRDYEIWLALRATKMRKEQTK